MSYHNRFIKAIIHVISFHVVSVLKRTSFFTPQRHGYSVKFSPFDGNALAVASSKPFGFVGGGTLFLLHLNENGTIVQTKSFEWSDGLFDTSWCKHNPTVLITACGDGGVQLWDVNSNDFHSSCIAYNKPKQCYREHSEEVCCVDWSHFPSNPSFLSSSWDCSVKLWNPDYLTSLHTYKSHSKLVNAIKFAKNLANVFASVSADGYLKIWNVSLPQPIASISVQNNSIEMLSCDWSETNQNIVAVGSSDGQIRIWDLRRTINPLFELSGCECAVRKVNFSPFDSNVLAAVSYDHTSRIWDLNHGCEPIETIRYHSECNYSMDWNRFNRNQIADCGWDSIVNVYVPDTLN